jgi:hypothetical protein
MLSGNTASAFAIRPPVFRRQPMNKSDRLPVVAAFAAAILLTVSALHAQVPQLLNYQGRVAVGTVNFDGTGQFKFALVDGGSAGIQASAFAAVSGGKVTAISVGIGGLGYLTPPLVTITGGGGFGAQATANITNGLVTSITVTNGGSGYLLPPVVTVAPPQAPVYTTYWSNDGTGTFGQEPSAAVSLSVVKGLYSVLLGDVALTNMTAVPATVFTNPDVRLRVWFDDGTNGFQRLTPDQRIAAAGYALMAGNVSDGAIGSSQLAGGAVTSAKVAAGAIGGTQLAASAVQSANIAAGAVTSVQLASGLTLGGTTTGTFSGSGAALANLNAGSVSSGTLADARLSSNVALRAGGNTFTGNQVVTSGSIGIGTVPTVPLHVSGEAIISGGIKPGATAQAMTIGATTLNAPATLGIDAASDLTVDAGATLRLEGSTVNVISQSTVDIDAATNLTVDAANTLRLEGTSVNVVASGTVSLQGAVVTISGLSTLGIGGAAGGFTLGVNGSAGKPGGGSWSALSDARLKKNIQPLDGSLERLLALRGVTFEYRDTGLPLCASGVQTGMIAQEVERVFPAWVEERADGYKVLTFRGFEALTVEALRELRAEKDAQVSRLRQENAALREQLADQGSRLAGLEAKLAAIEDLLRQRLEPAARTAVFKKGN